MADTSDTKKDKTASKSSSKKGGKKPSSSSKGKDTSTPQKVEKPTEPAFPAQDWLAVCKHRLGCKPWILRAAVSGQDSSRRYTEAEIRGLIEKVLSEPA